MLPVKTPNLYFSVIGKSVPDSPINYSIPGSLLLSIFHLIISHMFFSYLIVFMVCWTFSMKNCSLFLLHTALCNWQAATVGVLAIPGRLNYIIDDGLKFFPYCCDELPDRSSAGKGGLLLAHSLEVQSIRTGEVQTSAGV